MNYPFWINDGTTSKPNSRIFYEVARNGLFLHKKTPFWNVVVPVPLNILERAQSSLETLLPKIPAEITVASAQFFHWVYRTHRTEAAILLWIEEETNKYGITVPIQSVSGGHVHYDIPDRQPGELLIGTFHSHPDFTTFHSPTDQTDESSFDGIHAVLGNFSRFGPEKFQLDLDIVVHGTHFPIKPHDLFEGITKVETSLKTLPFFRQSQNKDNAEAEERSGQNTLQSQEPPKEKSTPPAFSYCKPTYFYRLTEKELDPEGYRPPVDWASKLTVRRWWDKTFESNTQPEKDKKQ